MEHGLDLEQFESGTHGMGMSYKFFIPANINRQWTWHDPQINDLLEKASLQMGQLNSFARLVPNIDLFIHLHVTKEAVVSSRIEGTRTNMDEALLSLDEIAPERRDDWQEVQNYTQALNASISELKRLPLSSRLLRQTHAILLQGVRGEHKQPGEFRVSQNWIGALADAIFIPPAHDLVGPLMGDLENFLHNDQIHVPILIRAGIAHYQFETIHPFLDGNGRIGRLLMTLYFVSQGMLEQPLLYLSAFFEKNKSLYYDNLTRVREKNDLLHWLKYFLVGVAETAGHAAETLRNVLALKSDAETRIRRDFGRRSAIALRVMDRLFAEPFIRVREVAEFCQVSQKTAVELVQQLTAAQLLKEFTGQSRNRLFVFEPYLKLFGE